MWSEHWVWINLNPLAEKKSQKKREITILFYIYSWPKNGSNIIKTQFLERVWNPIIKANLLDPNIKEG